MDLLAHLEAYVATADEASFSRAADRLGIAQPLLSRRIKTLEGHFGGPLFDRSRRQVTTTELGVLLLPYARDVLDRAQRLRQAAQSARRVRAVGVPGDCAPAALARALRAGTEHGITLGMRELPPMERESGLSDGSLAYALVRVVPERAALRVPLGLASAPAGTPQAPRALHLEELRPRRRRTGAPPASPPLPVLVLAEDRVPCFEERFARAVARAGLPEGRIAPAGPAADALTETLAGRALLLCTEQYAHRYDARWAPLGDTALHRGYDVSAPPGPRGTPEVPRWLTRPLAQAVGAVGAARHGDTGDLRAAGDVPARLAARG
ncbi:LysR family transcriptional regulator [Streptomyces malaysiense]|uniref:LysR family transcriptional regulator n=1 Tax=Streptomyces malaysiense TaxID=1428626 RepID=A0A1J4Q830_9ACTN|nr:LysR family transcriptional regulator [Streptomyces malaysiense]OIK28240.1 LysR family transcriptional regulator [Streptomyces malaysiense]